MKRRDKREREERPTKKTHELRCSIRHDSSFFVRTQFGVRPHMRGRDSPLTLALSPLSFGRIRFINLSPSCLLSSFACLYFQFYRNKLDLVEIICKIILYTVNSFVHLVCEVETPKTLAIIDCSHNCHI